MKNKNKINEGALDTGIQSYQSQSPTSTSNTTSTQPMSTSNKGMVSVNTAALKKPEVVQAVDKLKKNKIAIQVVEGENDKEKLINLEYLSEIMDFETGKISKPFTINDKNYQMVRAITPDRQKVMGVCSLDEIDENGKNIIYDVKEFEEKIANKYLNNETDETDETLSDNKESKGEGENNQFFKEHKHFIVNKKTGKSRKFKTIEELAKAKMNDDEAYMGIKEFKKYVDETLFGASKRIAMKEDDTDMSGQDEPELQVKVKKLIGLIQKKIPVNIFDSIKTNKIAQREVIAAFAELIGVPRNGLTTLVTSIKDLAKEKEKQQQQPVTENKVIKTIKVKDIK